MLIEVSKVEGEENKKEYKVTPKVSVQENKAVTVDVSEYTEPVEILPPEGKVAMEKVTLTLDNIADLEDNKNATIDVSTYTEPVEITPTAGKDGMEKVTVSLSNMPAGANMLYAWSDNNTNTTLYTLTNNPSVGDKVLDSNAFYNGGSYFSDFVTTITAVTENSVSNGDATCERHNEGDIDFNNLLS